MLSGVEKTQPQNTEGLNSIEISEDTESESGELFLFETEKDSESERDKIVFYQNMNLLENALFGGSFIDEAGPLVYRGVREFSEEVKGEFSPVVPEECPLPEELVIVSAIKNKPPAMQVCPQTALASSIKNPHGIISAGSPTA